MDQHTDSNADAPLAGANDAAAFDPSSDHEGPDDGEDSPDAGPGLEQADPTLHGFVQFTLTATTAAGVQATATMLATSADPPPSPSFQPSMEYWDLTADFLATLSQAQTLRFDAVAHAWDALKLPQVRSLALASTEAFAQTTQTGQFPASGVFARADDQDRSRGYGLAFESQGDGQYQLSWFQTPVNHPKRYAVSHYGSTFSRDASSAFAGKPSRVLRYVGKVVG
jgi:hypothetical protein